MFSRKFAVLFTKHKTRKRKIWQEGFIILKTNRKVILFDDSGICTGSGLDSNFLRPTTEVEEGAEIELDNYLVEVQQEISCASVGQSQTSVGLAAPSSSHSTSVKKQRRATSMSVGARKGFSVPSSRLTSSKSSSFTGIRRPPSATRARNRSATPLGTLVTTTDFPSPLTLIEHFMTFKEEALALSQKWSMSTRKLKLPDVFPSLFEYKRVFESSILCEVNAMLSEVAFKFACFFWRMTSVDALQLPIVDIFRQWPRCPQHGLSEKFQGPHGIAYQCRHSQCQMGLSTNAASLPSQIDIANTSKRKSLLRKHGIAYYSDCEVIYQRKRDGTLNGRIFLKIVAREPSSVYAMEDCWVVSSSSYFASSSGGTWTFLATSQYHSPATQSGMLELALLHGSKLPTSFKNKGKHSNVYALRCDNLRSEVSMLRNLSNCSPSSLPPLLPFLMAPRSSSPKSLLPTTRQFPSAPQEPLSIAEEVISEFGLNQDQAEVLRRCRTWFDVEQTSDPIILVHGVFGAGKSYLLTCVIIFLSRLLKRIGDEDTRILVSALTNVAVDRILLGLKDHCGFSEFARVGNVRRIAKPLLSHVLHHSEQASTQEEIDKIALKELRNMLADVGADGQDAQHLKDAIAELTKDRAEHRAAHLKSMRVVGATCAASQLPVLEGSRFAIVILDESSQVVEPMSLVPIAMFSAQRSLLVGDPQQLPPTLRTSPSHSSPPDDLSKTAFVRLQRAGVEPVMLRTQYRCHPCISLLSSRLFYGGELQDAASTDNNNERLVEWLPPLCFVDISDGQHVLGEGGSLQNSVELRVISDILRQLLSVEQISPDMIGVISLYKAQARRINASLSTLGADCESIQVSTVDAFQGAERDIIVLSTVRSSGIGFSSDPNRLNVALTRARSHLIIVGCKRALSTNNTWHRIIQYAGASAGLDAPFRLSPSAAVLRTSVSNAADLLPACNTNTKDSPGPTTTVGHYANDSLHAEVPQAQSNPQECTEFNHWVIGNQQKIAQEEESSPQSGTEFNHWVIGNQQKNAQEEESSPQSGTEFNHWVIGSQQENAQEAESSPQPGTEFNHWVIGNQHKIAQQEESSPQSGTELNHWVIGNQQGNTQQEESNPQPGTEFNHWVIGNQQGNMERARSILEEASGSDHQAIDIRLDNAANVSSCLRENAIPKESGSPHFIVESQMSQDKAIAKSFAGSEELNGISESNDSYWRSGTQRPQNSAVKTSTIQSRSKVEDELPAASDFDDIDLLF